MYITTILQRLTLTTCLLAIGLHTITAACQYKQTIKGESLSVGVMIQWSTSQEKENAMFIVERSEDGIRFTNVGAVKGAGNSDSFKQYSFLDNSKATGQRYYRLRQIDFNGAFATSPVLILNDQKEKLFSISNMDTPSAADQLEVQFDSSENGIFEFELTDMHGKSLLVDNVKATKGFNTFQVNLRNYKDIAYKLTLRSIEEEQTIIFKKQETSPAK